MEIEKANHIAFAYTVKTLGTLMPTKDAYKPFFDRLSKYNIEIEYKIAEKDSKGKLHYHGVFYLPKGFFRKRLSVNGIHMKLVELYDRKGWIKYIHKDVQYAPLEQMADELSDTDTIISIPDTESVDVTTLPRLV